MKQTGDLNLIKKINKSIVLDYLRRHSPISRARIAELTGLTKATVSSLVNELITSNLAHEIGAGMSSGGRKPMMLHFHAAAGYAIGIDLGVNYILAALTDLSGTLIDEYKLEHQNSSLEQVIELIQASIRVMIARAPQSTYGIVGIGIGVPGISDEQGNVLFAPNLGWQHVPLRNLIENEFNLPVVIDNEANAGAVGEKQFGIGKSAAQLVYLSIGMGIGTGIILKGELFRGSSGFSGEVGHASIQYDGKTCVCGNYGCWELYASENALLEAGRLEFSDPKITLEQLLKLAGEGSLEAKALFTQLGRFLGIGIVMIINTYNPEMIVIGGRIALAQQWLMTPMQAEITKRSHPYPLQQLHVQFSELGSKAAVLGACSFAISSFFSSNKVMVELQSYFPD
ncbi:ROK family transcriptional regulator [Paenibacillus eucommiae]|uniref:Glucokinase-like ROK family protein n=1 Tax=Paenibacillus eucommiae TaxID=1355755 RepID=A0ABS4IR62_9BACL|nr:ROK family transcriptional regulator [Paenibacillus eucommiae]MBP1990057.1 glucokinase-like ROK family protein [Paenibacillus eucommiae]